MPDQTGAGASPANPPAPNYFGTADTVQAWLDQNLSSYLEQNPGLVDVSRLTGGAMGGLVPAGTVADYAGTTAPPGWVLCDGSTYNAVTNPTLYLDLWNAIGGGWGTGGGTQAAFQVPDIQGRVTVGLGTNAAVSTLNNTEGVATVANRSPKHNSTGGALTGSPTISGAPGVGTLALTPNPHSHNAEQPGGGTDTGNATGGLFSNQATSTTSLSVTGAPSIGTLAVAKGTLAVGSIGPGGTLPNDTPAYITLNKIIKL